MSPDKSSGSVDGSFDPDIAEYERQFREILEHCPAGLNVVDEDGRLLFHNSRIRELFGYTEEELHLFDTRKFWQDLDQRARIIEALHSNADQVLNVEAIWLTKRGAQVHVLISYPQTAYRGGHISFAGGKRVLWVYDISALREREAQSAEHERQFREILDHCPAGLNVVDEDGHLLFHNAQIRQLLGYSQAEMERFDTRGFWVDLEQRARIIEDLREGRDQGANYEVLWKTKSGDPLHVQITYPQVAYRGGHISFVGGKRVAWIYDITALRQREAESAEHERQFREILDHCPAGLNVVDEDGRLLFHNARVRRVARLQPSRRWNNSTPESSGVDLDQRARIIESLREGRRQVLNHEVIWKTKQGEPMHVLISYPQVAYRGGHISFVGGKRVLGSTTSPR